MPNTTNPREVMRGHDGASRGQGKPRGATMGHVEPGAVIPKDFAQFSYQPAVISDEFVQFPHQPPANCNHRRFHTFSLPFPYQPALKLHQKLHIFCQGRRMVQKRSWSMSLCRTTVKMQVARTLCTHVRARNVFLKRFSKKCLCVETVCKA